ncbi:hypothetical protein JT359_18540 [Candidatus Poribacteria bacterium]|nr:hypothetical protein [Candidatus Poribacteria bacterium]
MKYRYLLVIVLALSLCTLSVCIAKLSDGLYGYWPLDGNGKDESGNGHDAKLEVGAKFVNQGWMGGAIEVDGAGGHAVVDSAFIVVSKNNETHFERRARGPRPYEQSSVKGKVSD